MLDDLNELKTFERVAACGSMSAAARDMGVSVAVVSRRLAMLEQRAGVRLINRTTRSLSVTEEGARVLAELSNALESLRQAEEILASGRTDVVGVLRVSAPVSFGRRHVAPVLRELVEQHPQLRVSLSLDDRLVDVAGGILDVALRIGVTHADSTAAMRRMIDNVRILVASPGYLAKRGLPEAPGDLVTHDLLRFGDAATPWRLIGKDGEASVPSRARMRADSGDALNDWCLAGAGIALRSVVDVAPDLAAGTLQRVLPEWSGEDAPVVALFPARTTMPRKTRVFLDAMEAYLALVEASLR